MTDKTMKPIERMSSAEFRRRYSAVPRYGAIETPQKAQIRIPKDRKVTKVEAEWHRKLFERHPHCHVKHEPFSLNLPGGVRYTPDWVVFGLAGEVIEIWECKGPHLHGNAARSIAAFKAAAAAFPFWRFGFAQKRETGWCEEIVNRKAS